MDIAQTLITAATLWLWVSAAVALVFLGWGIDRIDADARGAYLFRPLLIPGVLLLWPLVLHRWWQIEAEASPWMARYRPVRSAHPAAALAMCAAMALLLAFGLGARQEWPAHITPVQISGTGQ